MNGFNFKFFVTISITHFLFSCTTEVPQEPPPLEQAKASTQSSGELNSDETSEEVSQQIVKEVEEILQSSDQENNSLVDIPDPVDETDSKQNELADTNVDSNESEKNEQNLVVDDTDLDPGEQQGEELAGTDGGNDNTVADGESEETSGTVELVLEPKPQEFDEFGRTVSDEQDFASVVQRETIESDSQRIKENEENLVIYDPIDHPDKTGQSDVVSFALNTKHTPGTVLFRRNTLFFNRDQYLERCNTYIDSEAAQQAFLDAGGPEEDELKLDPDGDGFACSWNPAKYRLVLQ
ncbi:MAG: hypothetical protein OXF46_05870 [Rhodobacteraceae bacterium]|nr:hypothetical protein [Paracoccaceae bacterium]